MRRPLRSDEARSVANLAIDLGDPGRMSRARRMHRSNAVTDVEILPGVAHVSVIDPTGEIHEVSISVANPTVDGRTPPAADLEPTCSCDDDGDACTHALAALLGIAEEIEANGRLLATWAGDSAPAPSAPYVASSADGSFFDGPWASRQPSVTLTNLRIERTSPLVVDDLDAGPVVIDAVAAIRRGLSRYRAQ